MDYFKDVLKFVKTCKHCQLCKKSHKNYGLLPAKEAEPAVPWNRVNVDMIGPYKVKTLLGTHELWAFTMIDPATGWFEVKDIKNPSADECTTASDNEWLTCYPHPEYIGSDNGSEYKSVFKKLCKNYGITQK